MHQRRSETTLGEHDENRIALSQLLALQEGSDVDWDQVQNSSIGILASVRSAEGQSQYPAEMIVPYLTYFALRRQSAEEQHRQHGAVMAHLRDR